MADDLMEHHQRVEALKGEVTNLCAMIEDWRETAVKYHFEPARYPSTLATIRPEGDFYVTQTKEVSVAIRAKVGAIANEARATLDSLACQLAIRNGETADGVYFPISATAATFPQEKAKKTKKISTEDVAKIEALTPYGGGDNLLRGIHVLDLVRKHIRLTVMATRGEISIGGFHFSTEAGNCYIDDCTFGDIVVKGMAVAPFGSEIPELNKPHIVISNVPLGIVFNTGPKITFVEPEELKGMRIDETLNDLLQKVDQTISLFD